MNYEYKFIPYHTFHDLKTDSMSKQMIYPGNHFYFHAPVDGIVRIVETFMARINHNNTFTTYYADIGASNDPKELEYVAQRGYKVTDLDVAARLFPGLVKRGLKPTI